MGSAWCDAPRSLPQLSLVPDPTKTGRSRGLLKPLLRALGALVLAIGFAVLGSEIREGETQAFDMLA